MSRQSAGGRTRLLVVVGIVVIVASILGGLALFLVGQRQADESVRQLARAPVGCDTTLEFTETGTFVLFIETAGRLDGLAGGCDVPTTYLRDARPTRLSVELVDGDGVELSLDRTEESDYANDGFVAESFREVDIAESGRHVLRVTSPEDDFVVSIGRDPGDTSQVYLIGALAVGVFGTIAGAALVTVGLVRRRHGDEATDPAAPSGPPTHVTWSGPVPTGPPFAPPPPPTAPPSSPTAPPPPSDLPTRPPGESGSGFGPPVAPPPSTPFAPPADRTGEG